MAQATFKINLTVNDDGTAVIKSFSDQAAANLKKVENSGTSMGAGFAKTWQGMAVGLNQGIQLIQQVSGAIMPMIEAYMASETATLKMGMAMKNQGDYSRAALADMQEYAAQLQRTTAYEDDATLAVMGNLKSYGLSNEQVKQATKAALDLATAKAGEGMSVERASEIMGKAYLGIGTGLKKLGIQVDETKSKAELFDDVMKQINKRFGGSAQAELLTYAGQWKQLKNQWGDIAEMLGFVFLKTLQALSVAAGHLAEVFLTAGNAMLGMLRMIVSPLAVMLEGFAWLAEKAGMDKFALGLRLTANAIGDAQKNIVAARENVVAWTNKNYDALTSLYSIEDAIDKMGKAGDRTTAQIEADFKTQKDILKSLELATKSRYEQAIADADNWLMVQRNNGAFELNLVREYYDKQNDALWDYYESNWSAIEKTKMKESEKNAKLEALNAEYYKNLDKNRNELTKNEISAAENYVKVMAETYQTINAYSQQSYSAQIALLEAQHKKNLNAAGKNAEDIAALEEAKKIKIDAILIKQAEAQLGYYKQTVTYAENADEVIKQLADEQYKRVLKATGSEKVAKKASTDFTIDATLEKSAAEGNFWDGVTAQYEKDQQKQMTWGKMGIETYKEVGAAKTSVINSGVTAFIKGEDAKIAVQKAAGDMITQLSSSYATKAFDAAIGKTIGMIGAKIGEGAAKSGSEGASKGGAWGAVGEVALYLGTAVAAMLGGRALAQQFNVQNAEGGWIAAHPTGGFIRAGSGIADDVYLGQTGNTRHWGMGGEFVVNKESSVKYADLLMAINGRPNVVNSRGYADGGYVGMYGQELVGDPDELALKMGLGGWMTFIPAFLQSLGTTGEIDTAIAAGVAADIFYIVSAAGGALGGKALGSQFGNLLKDGGPVVDMGHSLFGDLLEGGMPLIPGTKTSPKDIQEKQKKWVEKEWAGFVDTQRAGWRNYADIILTPGTGIDFRPLDGLVNEVQHFGQWAINEVINNAGFAPGYSFKDIYENPGDFFGFKGGLDYVPRDNFRANLHEGEAVLTKKEANTWRGGDSGGSLRPVHVHLNLDGREVGLAIVKNGDVIQKMDYQLSKYNKRVYS